MPLTRHRFTVDEYHRMGEAGIFHEDDRVELLDGEIVVMSPIGGPHVACVVRLTELLSRRAPADVGVSVQNPVVVTERSEPQPDIAVLRRPGGLRGAWLPTRGDVLLVVEVADTSVRYDRESKIPLYAQAGIPEAWLVNLPADSIEMHSDPGRTGYTDVRTVRRGETISPRALPAVELRVDDILG